MITERAKQVRAETYAKHIRQVVEHKHALEEEIEHQRSELNLTGVALGERVSTSPSADTIPDGVAKLIDMIENYVTTLTEYVAEITEFNAAIEKLTANYRLLLYYRYVELLDWRTIATRINYSESHMFQLRQDSLIGLYSVMPGEWRNATIDRP